MFERWVSGMRVERRHMGLIFGFLALYILWVYILSPAKLDETTGDLVLALTTFDQRADPWLVWVHNIYGLYGIPFAVMMMVDDRDQSFPAWPFAVLSIVVLGIWPLFFYYALRQPKEGFTSRRTWWVRFLESPIPALYTLGFSVWLTYRALTAGDLAVLADYFVHNLYIHGCVLDLVVIWLFFPVAMAADMKRRGMESKALLYGLGLTWLAGPIAYLLLRRPLPRPQ